MKCSFTPTSSTIQLKIGIFDNKILFIIFLRGFLRINCYDICSAMPCIYGLIHSNSWKSSTENPSIDLISMNETKQVLKTILYKQEHRLLLRSYLQKTPLQSIVVKMVHFLSCVLTFFFKNCIYLSVLWIFGWSLTSIVNKCPFKNHTHFFTKVLWTWFHSLPTT